MGEEIMSQPTWVGMWVMYLAGLNFIGCAVFAWKHVEARWGLGLFLLSAVAMGQLYEALGYVRLLGITHIVVWTPLLIYFWRRREIIKAKPVPSRTFFIALSITNLISLAFDYADLARYILGERAPY